MTCHRIGCARAATLVALHLATAGVASSDPAGDGPQIVFTESAPLPAGTRVVRDIAYGPDPRQRFDAYIPAAPGGAPVIVMAHGGGWAFGNKRAPGVVGHKAAHWVAAGLIFVSVNYRLLPDAGPRTQAIDLANALATVQQRAASLGGDASRVVLMGHSAGAHLAALVHSDRAITRNAAVRPWLGTVVLDSAALDVPTLMSDQPGGLHVRAFGGDRAAWAAASPLHVLAGPTPPLLAVCAMRRRTACKQSRAYAQRANALGGATQVLPVRLTHAQINRGLGMPSEYTRRVDAFLRTLDPRLALLLR